MIMYVWFPIPIITIWVIRKKAPSTNCRGNTNARTIHNSVLTNQQYLAIVSIAEWQDIERIFL